MLIGERIILREATEADRRQVFTWLALSDLTPSMMGAPYFPDHPVPSWQEFCEDYRAYYFDGSCPLEGRCFIIQENGIDVGVVCHNTIRAGGITDMDIWLRSEADCGRGVGSDALRTLGNYLNHSVEVTQIVIAPSARNPRAIAAYKKVGFVAVPEAEYVQYLQPEEMEYDDTVVLVRIFDS